ncbi:hypothetical protein [Tissierella pigra]|uniref:Uncharacterized protein n=1 Tax=Tissierella pigra TaxID=2607614 RepID=A0A6N7XIB6_9FIRM|nr:hypothetical protein [Tissierella pigra]MSU01386.1 hypothetical protein [Tissierella pigra]
MNREYLEKIKRDYPWIWDKENEYYLIISDDMDSLLSAICLMSHRDNIKIGGFLDYREGFYIKKGLEGKLTKDNIICIDMSPCEDGIKSISNHVTRRFEGEEVNSQDINLSNMDGISPKNYFHKYNLNTFILIYSLLGLKPSSEKASALMLMLDSAYLPFYASKSYQDSFTQKHYLCDVLDLEEVWQVQEKITKTEFINAKASLGLSTKIYVDDEGVKTADDKVDLEGICEILEIDYKPEQLHGFFYLTKLVNTITRHINVRVINRENILGLAVTRRDTQKICWVEGGIGSCISLKEN